MSCNDSGLNHVLLWHQRLGHPNFAYLKKLMPHLFSNIHLCELKCDTCILAKQTRASYIPKGYESSSPFNLIHLDIWGPSRVASINGAKWFITFVDDHTRLTWVYLMKSKVEVGNIIRTLLTIIKTHFDTIVKVFRSDNGTEYLDKEVREYLAKLGIHYQTSCVYTPQQNGIAERKNRHLLEVARSIMFSMHVPKFYWGKQYLRPRT